MYTHYQKKTEELIDTLAQDLKLECARLYKSGMIDEESYHPAMYGLSKVLVTAALHRLKNNYAPHYDQGRMADVKNLIDL